MPEISWIESAGMAKEVWATVRRPLLRGIGMGTGVGGGIAWFLTANLRWSGLPDAWGLTIVLAASLLPGGYAFGIGSLDIARKLEFEIVSWVYASAKVTVLSALPLIWGWVWAIPLLWLGLMQLAMLRMHNEAERRDYWARRSARRKLQPRTYYLHEVPVPWDYFTRDRHGSRKD